MLPPIGENPAYAKQSAEDRAADIAWEQAQAVAVDMADTRITRHAGDVLAALVAWTFADTWRRHPDAFESLVIDATRLELESRLNAGELAAWHVIQHADQRDDFAPVLEAIAAKHRRHQMTTTETLRNAA